MNLYFSVRIVMNMTLNERKLLSPVNIKQVFSSHLTDTQDCTLYNDTKLVCKDGTIFSSRLFLSLAFPFLERPLAWLQKMVEPVIILPDFGADEFVRNIQIFLIETSILWYIAYGLIAESLSYLLFPLTMF